MQIKQQVLAKRWWLALLIFLIMMGTVHCLYAQESPVTPTAQSDSPLTKLTQLVKDWVNQNTELTIVLVLMVLILAWFKDKLGKAVTDGLIPLFGRIGNSVLVRFGAYNVLLKRYRETLQKNLQQVGLTQQLLGESVDLDRNYIPIQLSKEEYKHPETDAEESEQPGQRRAGMEEPKMERVEVQKVLADEKTYGNQIAIIGDPGSGKTTLLQYLAYQCTRDQGARGIPVVITLTAYVQHPALSFRAYLEAVFEENGFPKAKNFLEKQLRAGNFLILLDGFDEVAIDQRAEVKRQIGGFANDSSYRENKFIITSRPIREAVFDKFRHLEVMELTSQQRKTFLESKVDEKPGSDFNSRRCTELFEAIEEHDRIRKLAENPLLLTFLYHVYKYNLELPRRRVELYRLSVNLMLDWDMETNRPTHIQVRDRDAKKEVLKKVAYYYHTNNRRELPENEVYAQVKIYLPDSLREKFSAEGLIQEIENSSGILRHRTAETYQFIHLTFQEYLTADYINDNRDVELPKLMTNLHNWWWREVTLLLASTMGNGTPLVYRILDYGLKAEDESEKFSCLFIAFNCLFEAEIEAEARNQVLDAFVKLPYNQVLDVIQEIVGPFEAGNEELETLFVNILGSPHESVQAWGLNFLNSYPEIAETSERLTKRVQDISSQAIRQLPDLIQVRIIGSLSLKEITNQIWNILITDSDVVSFDFFLHLSVACIQSDPTVETYQKLLLASSAHLTRFLIGALTLQSTQQGTKNAEGQGVLPQFGRKGLQLQASQLPFTPDSKRKLETPDFSPELAEMWQKHIAGFIDGFRVLILALYPSSDPARKLSQELARGRAVSLDRERTLARDRAHLRGMDQAKTLARLVAQAKSLDDTPEQILDAELVPALDQAREVISDRALEKVKRLARSRDIARVRNQARSLTLEQGFFQAWALTLEAVPEAATDLELALARAEEVIQTRVSELAPGVDEALALLPGLDRAQTLTLDREVIEILLLMQDLVLACAIYYTKMQIQVGYPEIRFIHRLLDTIANQNQESQWYLLTIAQQLHASAFVEPHSVLLSQFQQLWEHRSDLPEIAAYQSAFFVNLATLLHTLGANLEDTFFSEATQEGVNPQSGFVLRVSYLLHQLITNRATPEEAEEFHQWLNAESLPLEQEWLELSGMMVLRGNHA